MRVRRWPRGRRHGLGIVDYDREPPETEGNPVRSERVQAEYVGGLLDVFASMGLYAAMAFEFISADARTTRTPASTPLWPRTPSHGEPKEAFRAVARRYRRNG
ncbi:hypothetical protein AB0N97_11485 [Streptomyces collinus]|uniref:hypothetical protein n=1 Tax=Streptomyces collinus TaxID=42684 RepID=UPI003421F8BC